MKDCRSCKDYRQCPGKEWYTYSEIRFCPYQVVWIIEHRDTLLEGNWPDSPDGSIYIDPQIRTGVRDEAYYAKPVGILVEVEARLKTTGVAGEALQDEVKQGLSFEQLSRPARRALMYVKGWRRKKQTFAEWMRDWRRGKTGKKFHKKVVLSAT